MADYLPRRPRPSDRGSDAGCSTRQGPRKCRTSTSRAQEARLVSHLSGGEGGDETRCWTPWRRPRRIPSFGETEALAQSIAGELLAIKGAALRELLRPGKGHCHRLETCIAHQLRGDLDRALVVARNGYSHRIACTGRLLSEVGIAHRVEWTHHVRALEIRFRRRTDAFFFRLLQQVLAVATGNRVGRVDHDLAPELGTVILGTLRDRLVGHGPHNEFRQ